jgi:hypothetical protein
MIQRGKVLEKFLTTSNLYIVNDRSEPMFETRRARSYVDLTIINNQLLRRVTGHAVYKKVVRITKY